MRRNPPLLAERELDLLVVGGGITGAAIAWDATLRGLSVGLVEKGDFGEATSSASSKLVHGGVRYLQQGLLHKVRESVRERSAFLRIAPHLVHPLPFLVPTYGHGLRGKEILAAGMSLYELATLGRNRGLEDPEKQVPRFELLGRDEVLRRAPEVPREGLTGGVVYHDAQMVSSERTTLAFVLSAADRGAGVANSLEVTGFLREGGRVTGARARDLVTGDELDIRARLTLNVTGPWAFHLASTFFGEGVRARVAFSKGIHVLLPQVNPDLALALATRMPNQALVNRGGRHVFLMPWRGRTLVGTTNVPFEGDPDRLGVTHADVSDFLEELRSACPAASFEPSSVLFAYGGLYPLIDVRVRAGVYQGSGEYRVYDHERLHGAPGLLTVIGAKFTTARRLAERVVDLAFRKLGHRPPPCRTSIEPLRGGAIGRFDRFRAEALRRHAESRGEAVVDELVRHLGTDLEPVLALAEREPALAEPVSGDRPVPGAWVVHAAREEMAMTLEDVVFRRTGIGTLGRPNRKALARCAELLAAELGWGRERTSREIERCEARFAVPGARP